MADFPRVPDWVPNGKDVEWEKALFDAKLKHVESLTTAENDVDLEFFKSVFAVAQGAVDRARNGAETVQKASAAIAALYTTLLGVVFSVKDNPLPSRGIIPMIFLGVAVVASTAYLAYQTRAKPVGVLTPRGSSFERNVERAQSLIAWTRRAAEHRGYLLRVGVVALALGLAFLPAPFLSFKSATSANAAAAAAQTTAAASTPTADWPTPSKNAGDSPALQRVVYAAQVAEVAEKRKAKTAPLDTGGNNGWWLVAGIAFVLMLAGPLLAERLYAPAQVQE